MGIEKGSEKEIPTLAGEGVLKATMPYSYLIWRSCLVSSVCEEQIECREAAEVKHTKAKLHHTITNRPELQNLDRDNNGDIYGDRSEDKKRERLYSLRLLHR